MSPEFTPVYGGVGAYATELLRHLPDEIDVHLVTVRREIQGMKDKECYSKKDDFRRNLSKMTLEEILVFIIYRRAVTLSFFTSFFNGLV